MKALQKFGRDQSQSSRNMSNSQASGKLLGPAVTPKKAAIGLASILVMTTLLFTYTADRASTANLNSAREASANVETRILELKTDTANTISNEAASSAVESTVTTNATNSDADFDVSINGRTIDVPANGSVEQSFDSSSGQTDVSVTQQSGSGAATNSSSSSTSFSISSSSSSSTDAYVKNKTDVRIRESSR